MLTPAPAVLFALQTVLQQQAHHLGFQHLGIANLSLENAETQLNHWLAQGWHGEMHYMAAHGTKRSRPAELMEHTQSVICVSMEYLSQAPADAELALNMPHWGYVSRYALGRDYHKVLRKRLEQLAQHLHQQAQNYGIDEHYYRVFVDSAPVLEKPLAVKANLGWQGKHTNVIHPKSGSFFFLGEIYTSLALPATPPTPISQNHCGRCTACLTVCPTQAIVAPYQLDARRCISYLTIELKGAIPIEFRQLIGNRIYGCDDCQLICPWNRFAHLTKELDFTPRYGLQHAPLLSLWQWTEAEFLHKTEGSAIRRLGYERWLRNIAVGLGNAPHSNEIIAALQARYEHSTPLVKEHIHWALEQQTQIKNKYRSYAVE